MSVFDEYLKNIPPPQKAELERIRALVKKMVPDAEETIGYGMPVFKYKGKYLLGISNFKDHMSIFPGAEPIEAFKSKLSAFKISKGTVQFTLDNPIPESLLKDIITHCLHCIALS